MAVPHEAGVVGSGGVLVNLEDVGAGLGEGELARLKRDPVVCARIREGGCGCTTAIGAGDESGCEREVIGAEQVSSNEALLTLDGTTHHERHGRIGVLEAGRGERLGRVLAGIAGFHLDDGLVVLDLAGHHDRGYPLGGVIGHALTRIGGHVLDDPVTVGLTNVAGLERDALEVNVAMSVVVSRKGGRAAGHGGTVDGRQGELEHAGDEAKGVRGVTQRLGGTGCPGFLGGVEDVRELGGGHGLATSLDIPTLVIVNGCDRGGGGKRAVVVVRHHHGHGVERARVRDTGDFGRAHGLIYLVDVGAGGSVGDIAEVEGNGSALGRALGLRDLEAALAILAGFGHGSVIYAT